MMDEPDVAEPQPDSVGAASGTAKCHHCGERITRTVDGWAHIESESEYCDPDEIGYFGER
jgi:hypothetical protein